MNITKERAQSILQTLPVGYYLKRNIEVELSETASTSYIDLQNEIITIAMNNFHEAHKSIASDEQLEETVRAILYHELSHALLTPKTIKSTNEMNIFEDERIETLLRNFYINVNFKQNISNIVNVNTLNDMVPTELFFKIVRFRRGPQHFVDRVSYLIKTHMHITAETTNIWEYEYDVKRFYEDVKRYAEQLKREYEAQLEKERLEREAQKQAEETQTESDENEDEDEEQVEETESDETEEETEDENEQIIIEVENDNESNEDENEDDEEQNNDGDIVFVTKSDENELTEEELKDLTDKVIQSLNKRMDSSETKQYVKVLAPIIKQAKTQLSNTSSAINAYSGVFNPRSVVNNDYRYFVQKNRTGHLKQFSKIRLNLYIDRSSSFSRSQKTVNAFLNALAKLEKEVRDFEFNVVTIGAGEKLHAKNDRQIKCSGGNALTNKIFEIARNLACTDCTYYNVVLFDGNAFSHDVSWDIQKMSAKSNFKVFNSTNTYIISDLSNQYTISKYAPLAKTTITENYASDFKQQILNILANVFR